MADKSLCCSATVLSFGTSIFICKESYKDGHDVTIIAASTVHNSDENLIKGNEKVQKIEDNGIPYVHISCSDYQGNGMSRVINMLEFSWKLPRVCEKLDKPDVIVATSVPLCHAQWV